MKLHDLKPAKGAHRKRTRVGRGIAAGQGKTSGRGQKGQGSRSGGVKGPYFEGGQLPFVRRLPFKRGFNNLFRIVHQEVNVEKLAAFKKGAEVNPATLAAAGLIDSAERPVVILGDGEVKAALKVSVHRISKSAQSKIEAAGGSVEKLTLAVKGARATIKLQKKSAAASAPVVEEKPKKKPAAKKAASKKAKE